MLIFRKDIDPRTGAIEKYYFNEYEVSEDVYNLVYETWLVRGWEEMQNSIVDHPDHYAKGRKFEPIEVIEDWELGFCLGNALKYISRAGRKDDYLNDLLKAKWYLEREIRKCQNV